MRDDDGIVLGIIPARGGSKGIPDKNIYPLLGKPLILYTVEAAQQSRLMDDFIVSTDEPRIRAAVLDAGVSNQRVPFLRPAELARDETPTLDVLRHAVEFYEHDRKKRVSAVVLLQPTAPLRLSEDIDAAIRLFQAHPEADSLISCHSAASMHPRILYRLDGKRATPYLDALAGAASAGQTARRQDFERLFVRNGAVYIMTRALLMEKGRTIGDHVLALTMPRERSINIDEIYDLEIAHFFMERRRS